MRGYRTRRRRLGRRDRGLTGNVLKIIAVVTMLLDHIGAAVIENGLLCSRDPAMFAAIMQTEQGKIWWMADRVLRTAGRIAFPIFCFLLVEGFLHTRNVKKYGIRLFAFALISEVPFDLAIFDTWFYYQYQNVFFTLFIGLLVLAGLKRYRQSFLKQMLVIAAGCGAAYGLQCDYDAAGVLLIAMMYLFHYDKVVMTVSCGIISALESIYSYGAAVLAYIPISLYNGKRGRAELKYFFYLFYPLHLLLLYGVRIMI